MAFCDGVVLHARKSSSSYQPRAGKIYRRPGRCRRNNDLPGAVRRKILSQKESQWKAHSLGLENYFVKKIIAEFSIRVVLRNELPVIGYLPVLSMQIRWRQRE